jgi:hypothetical protein
MTACGPTRTSQYVRSSAAPEAADETGEPRCISADPGPFSFPRLWGCSFHYASFERQYLIASMTFFSTPHSQKIPTSRQKLPFADSAFVTRLTFWRRDGSSSLAMQSSQYARQVS